VRVMCVREGTCVQIYTYVCIDWGHIKSCSYIHLCSYRCDFVVTYILSLAMVICVSYRCQMHHIPGPAAKKRRRDFFPAVWQNTYMYMVICLYMYIHTYTIYTHLHIQKYIHTHARTQCLRTQCIYTYTYINAYT
jgi:hypothetical protein